ncbi:MAG: hypothetical protein PHW62_01550 [Candidatus Ratteibacteria bacterium]|nr:hypothetical protein [Candidatus Ratteibacteria bacterium]
MERVKDEFSSLRLRLTNSNPATIKRRNTVDTNKIRSIFVITLHFKPNYDKAIGQTGQILMAKSIDEHGENLCN